MLDLHSRVYCPFLGLHESDSPTHPERTKLGDVLSDQVFVCSHYFALSHVFNTIVNGGGPAHVHGGLPLDPGHPHLLRPGGEEEEGRLQQQVFEAPLTS